jgi:GMP synthase (glutamine-hydrolysing)
MTEIAVQKLDTERFIAEKVAEIKEAVGKGTAINALSGGVESSTVTILGHRALGKQLRTVFIENGLMREGEPDQVASLFRKLGVTVEVIDARDEFFTALQGITDPEEKRSDTRHSIRCLWTYRQAKWGEIPAGLDLTDVDETVAGSSGGCFSALGDPQGPLAIGSSATRSTARDGVRGGEPWGFQASYLPGSISRPSPGDWRVTRERIATFVGQPPSWRDC